MTKLQALTLIDELADAQVACSAAVSFSPPGAEIWTVKLPSDTVYNGPQLAAIADACDRMELNLSAQFSALGIK